jgi:hypothetical protein
MFLRGTNQEGQTASAGKEFRGDADDLFEVLDGAQGHDVEASLGVAEILGAAVEYIDVRQCKRAGYLAEEDGFLVVGFNQGEIDAGVPEPQGDAREAGAGTDIGEGGPVV